MNDSSDGCYDNVTSNTRLQLEWGCLDPKPQCATLESAGRFD